MKKILIIVGIVVVAIVLAVSLLISPIAKSYIEKHSPELVGRQVTMDKLCINIFTGGVKVQGLAFESQPGDSTANFVELDTLSTRISIFPMIRSRFIVNKMHLSGLRVAVWQNGDKFNFDDILAKFPADTTVQQDAGSSDWAIGIYDIKLRNSNVDYRDIAVGSKFDMNDISLDIPGVYFSGKSTDMGLHLKFAQGGELNTQMSYDIESSQYKINLNFKDYSIAAILPYVRQYFNIGELAGLLTTDINVVGDVDHVLDFTVKGSAEIRDLNLLNDAKVKLAAAKSVRANINDVQLSSERYILDSLTVDGFSTLFEIYPDGKSNFSTLLRDSAAADVPSVDTISTNPIFAIALLTFNDGQVNIVDNAIPGKFEYLISGIKLNSVAFRSDQMNNVSASAVMNRSGKAVLQWKGDMEDMNNQNITIRLANVNLTPITPYLMQYFAYPMTAGSLSFTSQNIITGGMLKGANHLEAYKVEVGKKNKQVKPEYKIPLKTVLYVLKDKNDRIDMSLPVSGNINSPEFSYRKIIIKTILNLMAKVATAPISFMGNALGITKGDDLQQLAFVASQIDFTLEQYAKLKNIAESLKSYSEMEITFSQNINYAAATQSIAVWELKKAFYLSANPSKVDALETIDYEAIRDMSDKNSELISYADSLVGPDRVKESLAAKATTLYGDGAQALLTASLQNLDTRLKDYLVREGVEQAKIKIATEPIEKMKVYTGTTMYNISVGIDGESTAESETETINEIEE